ncbi:glycosyltransferase [Hymenobacter busanensis]|uniref:Glycosyltransferase n=1 Tax=Hymenobacter busanensis TaxID=2607656 RepID=A0A7L5A0V9_9BACT|nr:TIGR04283 family arsenosugar biosynthesis glycosyltransferase [Hymenobacter busanensis]KAA9332303.1 glycosyltransferase [Hymenobacter busanensis]QHJ07360.1 glycosyltransferase [Hymenobacter busanensis]
MHSADSVSIIIPTYQEAGCIGPLIHYLRQAGADTSDVEIIVADGQSTDGTATVAADAGARVVSCPQRGRATQMNHGAAQAQGQLLYFLHADTFPPAGFLAAIRAALGAGDYGSGCFRLRFDHPHWFLRLSAWFTRFPVELVRFGDQSLFVRREVFAQAGGFRTDMVLLEDQEIIPRLRRYGRFRLLPAPVVTSARKYLDNGIFRLQGIFLLLCVLYRLGVSQSKLRAVYRALVQQDKI